MEIKLEQKPEGVIAYFAFSNEKNQQKQISDAMKKGLFKADFLETCAYNENGNILLFIGLGKNEELADDDIRKASATAVKWAKARKMEKLSIIIDRKILNPEKQAVLAAEGAILSDFEFNDFKTKDKDDKKDVKIELTLVAKKSAKLHRELQEAIIVCEAQNYARRLVNLPPNIATPEFMMKEARKLADEFNLDTKVFDKQELKKMGANGILAVGEGSPNHPYLVHLIYKGGKKKKIALVGKGVTFDSGGINTKPSKFMETMHMDKSGACVVLGILKAAAQLKLPFEIHGVLGLTENMPDGTAYKINDIIKMMSGKTVEIYHTDAEGRLVLGDCVHYASEKIKPDLIIDYATLTGAINVVVGRFAIGLFSNDNHTSSILEKAGYETNERVWRLPMWKEYGDLIKGSVTDIRNTSTSEGEASSITGAKFIENFVGKGINWVHLDIASMMIYKG
ncbi:MAG: leucyl aminopeptidase, partial [Candidatus Micrarchaeota archaeon]|nr:leucyl aminopeptidase [Candidatus Micrarchaeota archaeon]